jgi:hypothetical protein
MTRPCERAEVVAFGNLVAGGLKLVYDHALYKHFAALPATEAQVRPPQRR